MAKSKNGELAKNTLLFTINSFGSKIISFLLVPLYTSVLSTRDYGSIDIMTSTAQLLIPLLTLNIQDAVLRFSLDKTKSPQKVMSVGYAINVIATFFLAVVLLALKAANILNFDATYIYFLFAVFVTGALQNSLQMYAKAIDKVNLLVISGISSTAISCLSNVLLLLVFKLGIYGYFISYILGHLSAVIIMLFGGKLYKGVSCKLDHQLAKEMILFSAPLAINSISWWINSASDKYILTFFWGVALNGIYSVAYKIPSILSMFQSIFYNAWSVSAITEFDKTDSDGFIGNTYSMYSCISTVGCSGIILFNILLAKLLYAKDFFEAWHFVPFLLLGVTLNGIALFEGCLFTAAKKTREVSKTTIIGAIINTICNFALIPFWGANGAAIATMIGYFAVWIVRTISLQKIIKMKVSWRKHIIIIILLMIQMVLSEFAIIYTYAIQVILFILIIILQLESIKKNIGKLSEKIKRRLYT